MSLRRPLLVLLMHRLDEFLILLMDLFFWLFYKISLLLRILKDRELVTKGS